MKFMVKQMYLVFIYMGADPASATASFYRLLAESQRSTAYRQRCRYTQILSKSCFSTEGQKPKSYQTKHKHTNTRNTSMKSKSLCTFSENEKMQKFVFTCGERQWKSRTASSIEKQLQIKTNLRSPVFGNEQKAQPPPPVRWGTLPSSSFFLLFGESWWNAASCEQGLASAFSWEFPSRCVCGWSGALMCVPVYAGELTYLSGTC